MGDDAESELEQSVNGCAHKSFGRERNAFLSTKPRGPVSRDLGWGRLRGSGCDWVFRPLTIRGGRGGGGGIGLKYIVGRDRRPSSKFLPHRGRHGANASGDERGTWG